MKFFCFICVESEPPHGVAVYSLPSNAVLAGAHLCDTALARYAQALNTGTWCGYPDHVASLPFPKWATTFTE
jgi:hypothetical protein